MLRLLLGKKLSFKGFTYLTVFSLSLFSFYFLFSHSSFAATYHWNQSDWSGGADESNFPNHTDNQSAWTKYFSKDDSLTLNSGSISLSSTQESLTHNSSIGFTDGTLTNVEFNGDNLQLRLSDGNKQISTSSYHNCALKNDGIVWCWGNNSSGQLGNGLTSNSPTPVQVLGNLTDVSQISAGTNHLCALKTNGAVWCWGSGSSGQLGDGSTTQRLTPVQVHGVGNTGTLTGVSQVSAGKNHTCALKNDGTVWCWGENYLGQLGNNGYNYGEQQNTPVQVHGAGNTGTFTDVSQISAGSGHTCALKTDGTAWCWGDNNSGQLGDGSTTQQLTPVQVILTNISQISASLSHTCALKTDGTAWCWGSGANGKLGNGLTSNSSTPAQVQSGTFTDVSQISAGENHTCATKNNNTVWCWGYNNVGQIGDGSTTQRLTPVQVHGVGNTGTLTDVSQVSSGYYHTCAFKNDGTVWCWGENWKGQLGNNGDNYFSEQYTPVQVLGVGASGVLVLAGFSSSGNFLSPIINLGKNVNLTSLSLGKSGTTVKVQIKTSDTEAGLSSAAWSGPTGIGSYYTSTTSPESISLKSFVQYQAILETTDPTKTPQFSSLGLSYQSYASSGILISSPYDSQVDENLISGISWMKSTPDNTSIKYQLRSASNQTGLTSSNWLGPDGTSSTYFTSNLGETTPSSLRDGLSDRWLQYKLLLSTDDTLFTPTLYDNTLTYVINAPPSFDSSYQTNGFGITRATSPGIFNFLYKIGDTDTVDASAGNQYHLWPTFQYTLDNGGTWTTIATDQLTGYTTNNPVTLVDGSTYVEAATVWDATSELPNTYDTIQVRVIIDDHEAANNTATVTSDSFIIDTKEPTVSTVEGGGLGININHNQTTSLAIDKTNNPNVTLYFNASDDSSLKLRYSLNSSFTNTDYQDYVSSVGFTLPSASDGSKQVYVQFKDNYNNESEIYSDVIQFDTTAPNTPPSLFSKDVSTAGTSEYRIFLNWPKNQESDWANYKVYQLNNENYDLVGTIDSINTNYFVKSDLDNLSSYIFKVTSLDDLTNESVGITISQSIGISAGDTTPPTITNIQVSNKTTSSATISWTTNETSTSSVLYSQNSETFEDTKGIDGYTLSHSVNLSGLSSTTEYFYKVRTIDAAGNISESEVGSFTTNQSDTTGPVISDIGSTSITSSTAVINFTTNESASSFIEYSTTSGFSQGDVFGQVELSLSHSLTLRSLSPSTTYYYKIRSSDSLSNETVSSEYSFTTLVDPSDVTGPIISEITTSNITYNSATIAFSTNETALSFVEYGLDTDYGQIYGNNIEGTSHSITLPASLSPQTIYYYRVRGKDSIGNETIGVGYTFTTLINPADSTPPTISNIEIGTATQNSVTITWETNESATSFVGLSQNLTYSQEYGSSVLTQSHSVDLVGLTPGTTYFLRIKSADASGNISYNNNNGQGHSFTTVSANVPPVISSITVENIATDSAKIKWNTDSSANSYVEYWINDNNITTWFGNNTSVAAHEVTLNDLLSQTTYYFRVRSKDENDSEAISDNQTLITLSSTTSPDTSTDDSSDTEEETILDKIKNGTVDFVKKVIGAISDTSISEDELTDSLNSMTPNIISSPSISSSNITVDPGVDKITVSWTTDKKSNSVVVYTPDSGFNSANPVYSSEVGKYDESVTSHSIDLINLNPNTTYHYKVRSKSEYGNWTDSSDFTFTTLSVNSEIKDFRFTQVTQKSAIASWSTTFDSRAMVEIIDILTDKSIVKSEEKGFSRDHSFTTDQLQTSTNYQLQIITVAKDGTVSEASLFPFSTSTSSQPPIISNVRISNALISGTVEQVQTIISWKTDKPSTSRILYNEGTSNELSQSTSLDKSLVTDHVVVTTNLKPGKVYKFKTESVDSVNNASLSKDYLIMTPKTQESVVNLIIDNFLESFSFITKGKQ